MYGFIDGFSRKVLSLQVSSSNNKPEIIANHFLKLVKKLNCVPTILRTDKGTEVYIMGDLPILFRVDHEDKNDGVYSHVKEKSTNNQRIESYWRRFRQHLGQFYIDLFKTRESENLFIVSNILHIKFLRYCFGKVFTDYVHLSRKEWNEHRVRKQNGKNVTGGKPNEMYAWPQKFGKMDRKQTVDVDFVDMLLNDKEYSEEPHLCSPDFVELVELLMPGTRTPTTNEKAFDFHYMILGYVLIAYEEIAD